MKIYEVTFDWPNGNWTWIYIEAKDFHEAILRALAACPQECRVHKIFSLGLTQKEIQSGEITKT